MSNLPIKLRSPVEEDFNFIINSWLKSYRNSNFATHIPNDIYFIKQAAIIKRLLETSLVVIVCSEEDSSQILGYVVYELRENLFIVHFVYLKYTYRKLGLMKSTIKEITQILPESELIFLTHLPRNFEELKKKFPYIYNPYLLEK